MAPPLVSSLRLLTGRREGVELEKSAVGEGADSLGVRARKGCGARGTVFAHTLGLRDKRKRVSTRERLEDFVSRDGARRKFCRAVGPRGGPMGAGFIWLFRV